MTFPATQPVPLQTLCVVVPVFNDWASFRVLLEHLDAVAATLPLRIFVSAIDDGSTEPFDPTLIPALPSLAGVEVVHLALNVGHQRAIAIGLCQAVEDYDLDAILVMDGDGEDQPEAIPTLLQTAAGMPEFCIVVQRRKRTEKLTFRTGYLVYKALFKLVTGREINFGNFSMTSRAYARRLVMISDLWNNLAAAVLRSKFPVTRVPMDRGHRYAGSSKMNFVSLVIHGLSGISVYAETIFVRLLLFTLAMGTLTFVSIVFVVILRLFFPAHATPGWATTVSFSMIIILMQVFFTVITAILMLLNSRVQRLIIPITEFRIYIATSTLLSGQRPKREA